MRQEPTRWTARPGLARTLRAAVFLVPVAASVAAAWIVSQLLPSAAGRIEQLRNLVVVLAVSTVALWLVDRLTRRLLPLATLFELGLLFPHEAPSHLDVVRGLLSSRSIEEQLDHVREFGADPTTASRAVSSLLAALSVHDRPTHGHADRVRMFTDLIAEQLQLAERERDLLRWSAMLHDIGKLRVPAAVLNKPGKPDAAESTALHAHPEQGAEIVRELLPWLAECGEVIAQHHEKWDGTGYPNGLSGRQICLGARIVAVADAFDVMTAGRAYQPAVSRAAALRELVRCSGTQFDPLVVRALLTVSLPRLRRSQGVVAWLADIPLVAANIVPVANLARLIGIGALATGTLTPGQSHQESLAPPPALAAAQRPGAGGDQPPSTTEPVYAPAAILATTPSPTRTTPAARTPIAQPTSKPATTPAPAVTAIPVPGLPIPALPRPAVPMPAKPVPAAPITPASALASGAANTASGRSSSVVIPNVGPATGPIDRAPFSDLLRG